MIVLAIDPGTTESGFVVYDTETKLPLESGKDLNEHVMTYIEHVKWDKLLIEMVAHYGLGMPAGKTVFETCVWIGRFWQHAFHCKTLPSVRLVYRKEVCLHLCGSVRAKDKNVIQVLKDRYGGERKISVGTKAAPGPLYGFKADAWQALGVAVTGVET